METRVALIGIIIENPESVERLNGLLHEYGSYIIGRMGIPYREKGISIISVVMDAPMDQINGLSGKLGMLEGVSTKTIYTKITDSKTRRTIMKKYSQCSLPQPLAFPAWRLLIFRFRHDGRRDLCRDRGGDSFRFRNQHRSRNRAGNAG